MVVVVDGFSGRGDLARHQSPARCVNLLGAISQRECALLSRSQQAAGRPHVVHAAYAAACHRNIDCVTNYCKVCTRLGLTLLTAVLFSFQQPASTQAGSISFSPNTIDFGNVFVGLLSVEEVTATPSTWSVVSPDSPFSHQVLTCLDGARTCTVLLFFAPTTKIAKIRSGFFVQSQSSKTRVATS
jgi:hypothetical protein